MNRDFRSIEPSAAGGLERVQQQLDSFGLYNRSALSAALVLSMSIDLSQLREASFHLPVTLGQTALLALALWAATLRERGVSSDPAPVLRAPPRKVAYLVALGVLASFALVQKWWIVVYDASFAYAGTYRVMSATFTFASLALSLGGARRVSRYFAAFAEQPARQTALSFVALAVFGAFLLTLPICIRDPTHVSFVDALFMATSAVCVTGLAVHGLAAEYTTWGQAVLLALVQVGGLGIMVLSASMVVLTGRKLRARSSVALAEVLDTESLASLRGNIRSIVLFTLAIEAAGAVLLYVSFSQHPEVALGPEHGHPMAGSGSLLWASVFHAVSAFCNAGFTLTVGGLVPFATSYVLCTVVMVLILLGGVGFPVLSELVRTARLRLRGQRPERMSLHTRTVLTVSTLVIALSALALGLVEWQAGFADLRWHERIFAALFQAVTLRTAGFNTVDFASFSHAGLMVSMLAMFIGASPGGTGGGLKVTTFAVLVATLRAELRGQDEPSLFDRRLPAGTVRRAIALSFVGMVVLTLAVLLLLMFEPFEPIRLAFEAVSAFGTVGLSTDLTPRLGPFGKIVIIFTMLIGRVGPLTVALAASERGPRARPRHPHERVLIG